MAYKDIYWHNAEHEERLNTYIKKPSAIDSIKDIGWYNERAARAIQEAQSLIVTMKEYQQALYERYQEIAATNYHLHLLLKRDVHYQGTKSYEVTICKRFDGPGIADEIILREKFEGKERHKALKRFEALKKEYPNIEAETDIEKRSWER